MVTFGLIFVDALSWTSTPYRCNYYKGNKWVGGAFWLSQCPFAFEFECEWQFGCAQVIWITIRSFTLKNINIFDFEMSGQIAIWPFSIKKAWKFLNSQMAIQPYTSHSAIYAQTQTESEAFKTHGWQPVNSSLFTRVSTLVGECDTVLHRLSYFSRRLCQLGLQPIFGVTHLVY